MRIATPLRALLCTSVSVSLLAACAVDDSSTVQPTQQAAKQQASAAQEQDQNSEQQDPFEFPAIDETQVVRYYVQKGKVNEDGKPLGRTDQDLVLQASCSSATTAATASTSESESESESTSVPATSITWTLKVGTGQEESGVITCGEPQADRVIQVDSAADVSLQVDHAQDPTLNAYISVIPF